MENQSRTRTQRGRYLRWVGVGIALAGWGVLRLWQQRAARRTRWVAPGSEVSPSPTLVEVEPEPIEIPIVSTLQAPETLAEVETPPVLPVAAETAIAPEGDTSKDAITPVVDDLCRIAGIGPKVAALLNTAGVSTFVELAAATPEHLREALQAAGLRFMDPDTWPQQAELAAQGDWEALASLQAALKGGRRV